LAIDPSERSGVAGDPLVVHIAQQGADEPDDGRVVREPAHDAAAALDLLVDPLERLVDQILRQCDRGKPVKASTSAWASSMSGPARGT